MANLFRLRLTANHSADGERMKHLDNGGERAAERRKTVTVTVMVVVVAITFWLTIILVLLVVLRMTGQRGV